MNDQCYHYLISHAFRFPQLVDLATNGAVSAYLPRITGADCFLRLVTTFNLGLIKNLFDFSMDSYSVGMLYFPLFTISANLGRGVSTECAEESDYACARRGRFPGHPGL